MRMCKYFAEVTEHSWHEIQNESDDRFVEDEGLVEQFKYLILIYIYRGERDDIC